MADPLLSYSVATVPVPLQVNVTGASVTVTASNPGGYSDKADSNYVAPTQVVFDFGALLTADPSSIQASATYYPSNGSPVAWGSPVQSGTQFTFNAPSGEKVFPGDGLAFVFRAITVGDTVASVTMGITETASSPGDPANQYYPPQPSEARYASSQIGIFPTNFAISTFAASPAAVGPGSTTQLSWSASPLANTTFTLVYAVNGAVQTVTKHADNNPLQATDTYPNSSHDPGVVLALSSTTTFTLLAAYTQGTSAVQAQQQITVSVPDPTIEVFTATPEKELMVGKPVQMAWQTLAADYVTISPALDGVSSLVLNSGTATIYPLEYNRYTLTASGRGLNVRRSLVLFPLPVGWSAPASPAPWQSNIEPLLLATGQALWILPASPTFSTLGLGTNPIYSSPDGLNWILLNPNAPMPVRQGGSTLTDLAHGKMWVLGGVGKGNVALQDVWSSADGLNWTQVCAQAAWSARSRCGFRFFNNKYWVLGGLDGSGNPLGDVWNSPDGVTWTQVAAPGWSARSAFGLTVFQGTMWMVGGITAQGAVGEVWQSNADGTQWTQQPVFGSHGTSPAARGSYQLFAGDSSLYAFAGAGADDGNSRPVFYKMSAAGEWLASSIAPGMNTAALFGSTPYNGALWLAGGAAPNTSASGIWTFRPPQSS